MKNSLLVRKIKRAFSIIEILVALVVVSVITAALAPVITKKLKSSSITVLGGHGGVIASRQSAC